MPKWETVYVISDAWVWKWFLRGFWERVESEGLLSSGESGWGLGRVEKGLGARVRNWDRGLGLGLDRSGGNGDVGFHGRDGNGSGSGVEEDGYASQCSSRGRGADGDGIVREGQVWVDSDNSIEEDDLEEDSD